MLLFFICLLVLAGITGAALELVTHAQVTQTTSQASRRASNVQLMAVHLDRYVAAHPMAQGVVAKASLALPGWYLAYPGVVAYVDQGAAYLYQRTAAVSFLRDVAGPGISAGIKQASGAVTDMTGRTVAQLAGASLSAIPTGSAVVVVRHAIVTAVPPPALANADPDALAGLPAGPGLAPPQTFPAVPVGSPVPWDPAIPPPPSPPAFVPIDWNKVDVTCAFGYQPNLAVSRPMAVSVRADGGLLCRQTGNFVTFGGRLPVTMNWTAYFLVSSSTYTLTDSQWTFSVEATSAEQAPVTCQVAGSGYRCVSAPIPFHPAGIVSDDQRVVDVLLTMANAQTGQTHVVRLTDRNFVCGAMSGGMSTPCM